MPQLPDPNFKRAVVLLCTHNPEEGAFGLVVNRPVVTTGPVMVNVQTSRTDEPTDERTLSTDREMRVWIGGPVEPRRSLILVGSEIGDEGTRIADGLYLSTSPGLLRKLFDSNAPPDARLIIGYSGWAPGQLEAELEASSWLLSDVDRELIFNTPPEQMWETAIRRLGADPASLQMSKGVH
jgi:putative transcriptional regulator